MDSIAERGMDKKPFSLTCSHCMKSSRSVPWEDVDGKTILDVIKLFDFVSLRILGGLAVFCSAWCRLRYAKKTGIHGLLNTLTGKTDAFKQ